MSSFPPRYSPPPSPSLEFLPSYSFEPSADEQRLAISELFAGRLRPTGTFAKASKKLSVILEEQEDGVSLPVYGRDSAVRGVVRLVGGQATGVVEIVVKLEGDMSLSIVDGGTNVYTLFSITNSLWKNEDQASDRPSRPSCPSVLPFQIRLPSTCELDDQVSPLPPSYHMLFSGFPAISVRCTYTLTVSMRRSVRAGPMKWNRSCSDVSTELKYRPRSRPYLPIFANQTPTDTPEDWSETYARVDARPNRGIEPIDCYLSIPFVKIFSITDTIPIRVRVVGNPASLQGFFDVPSSSQKSLVPDTRTGVRVHIARRISVKIRQETFRRSYTIGEGTLRPANVAFSGSPPGDNSLRWEGEVRCKADVNTGGFRVQGKLSIDDFIVLTLTPVQYLRSPFAEHRITEPIRLTTESWSASAS